MDPVVHTCHEISTNRNAIETMHTETALSNAVLSYEEDTLQTKHIKKRNETIWPATRRIASFVTKLILQIVSIL